MKTNTKKLLIGLFGISSLLLCELETSAQLKNYNSIRGSMTGFIRAKESFAGLEGNPYLYEEWKDAFVRLEGADPGLYTVKYDQLNDIVVVKANETEEEFAFSNPVKEFKFKDTQRLFRNDFSPTGTSLTNKSYYEVLFDGTTKYLKRNGKMVIEGKMYNSATLIKKIEENYSFYLVKGDNQPVQVKNNEKGILGALDKQAELTKYIKENKLNLKTDTDVAKLLTYYDSLKQGA